MRIIDFTAQPLRAFAAAMSLAIVALVVLPAEVNAGVFNWGNLSDPSGDVMFLDVEEDNAQSSSLFAPMPGDGGPTAVLDSLILDPQTFLSQATNGAHAIDSEFSTVLMVDPDKSIDNIFVTEFGDYSLGGLPAGLATAQVGATFFWQVLEIDGSVVDLPLQTQPLTVSTGSGPNGGIFQRPTDDGLTTPWEGLTLIDVDGYLDNHQIVGDATKVSLIFDNTLLTAADLYSYALIKKKGVTIEVTGDGFTNVPEPSSLVLLCLAGLAIVGQRRRNLAY